MEFVVQTNATIAFMQTSVQSMQSQESFKDAEVMTKMPLKINGRVKQILGLSCIHRLRSAF